LEKKKFPTSAVLRDIHLEVNRLLIHLILAAHRALICPPATGSVHLIETPRKNPPSDDLNRDGHHDGSFPCDNQK
jgi:hypothetical protein